MERAHAAVPEQVSGQTDRDASGERPHDHDHDQEQDQDQEEDEQQRKTTEQALLLFFGPLGPVEGVLTWGGRAFAVRLHILTVEEENKVASYVAQQAPEHKVMAEAVMRIAYSLLEVDGSPVTFGRAETHEEFGAKMEWIASWPGTLLDAAIRTYSWAAQQPLLRLEEMRAAPNSEAALSTSG